MRPRAQRPSQPTGRISAALQGVPTRIYHENLPDSAFACNPCFLNEEVMGEEKIFSFYIVVLVYFAGWL